MNVVATDLNKFAEILGNLPNNQLSGFISYFVHDFEKNKSAYFSNTHIFNKCVSDHFSSDYDNLNRPFLSVVVRTQGNRQESLQLNFDSLKNQKNQDFEIVLVCHKVSEDNKKSLLNLIETQDPVFRKKINVHYLEDGNRTAPLNYGFSVSKGKYIAVLDDDDVALDNWVDEFYKASLNNYGKTLHAFVEEQNWSYNNNELIKRKLKNQEYCEKFSICTQVELNRCPINGLAFPSYAFNQLYIIFDETLTTNEDWDFLMRTTFVTGVYDIEKITAIYVRRDELANAYTDHSQTEWKNNISCIKKKFDDMPILYPAGESKSRVRYEWRPINFYHLFKIYKKTVFLNILCHLTFFMFKKLNNQLKDNNQLLQRIKNNEKEFIFKL